MHSLSHFHVNSVIRCLSEFNTWSISLRCNISTLEILKHMMSEAYNFPRSHPIGEYVFNCRIKSHQRFFKNVIQEES